MRAAVHNRVIHGFHRWTMISIWLMLFFPHSMASDDILSEAGVPKIIANESELITSCLETLTNADDETTQVHYARALFCNERFVRQQGKGLRPWVEAMLDKLSDDQLSGFASVVAHYPGLHDRLIDIIGNDLRRDQMRLTLVRLLDDYAVAKRLTETIKSERIKRYALEQLIRDADHFDEKLSMLNALMELQNLDDWAYGSYYELRPYASEFANEICDSICQNVPLRHRPRLLNDFATMTVQSNTEAAERYDQTAWREIALHPKPWDPAITLLQINTMSLEESEWMAKFDMHVQPALKRGQCGIGILGRLVQFGLPLMIRRTEQSCVIPARSIDNIFPSVMEDAFTIRPNRVMDWIQTDDRLLPRDLSAVESADVAAVLSPQQISDRIRDQVVSETCMYLSAYSRLSLPQHRDAIERLCEAATEIHSPKLRLKTLAALADQLPRLNLAVPERVYEAGRRLLNGRGCIQVESQAFDQERTHLFCLLDAQQQLECIEAGTDVLRRQADPRTFLEAANRVMVMIQLSRIPESTRMDAYQRLAALAADRDERRLLATIAQSAVQFDPHWSIRTVWSSLPADRGRSGKPDGDIGYTPAPSDSGDAVMWLQHGIHWEDNDPLPRLKLTVALYQSLDEIPAIDRDPARKEIVHELITAGRFDHAWGVISEIQDDVLKAESTVHWVGSR